MKVTFVNDWHFLEDANMDEAIKTIKEYLAYLLFNEPELELGCQWLKTNVDPRRHFRIATYNTQDSLDQQIKSEGTRRFVDRSYPLIDRNPGYAYGAGDSK